MPDLPDSKAWPHPWRVARQQPTHELPVPAAASAAYVELQCTTNFTFLTGASHAEELMTQAAKLGYPALAITDTNTLAGMVRAHIAARAAGVRLIVGCRLRLTSEAPPLSQGEGRGEGGPPNPSDPHGLQHTRDILVYPTDRAAYGRLCRLLTRGQRQAPKGQCHLTLHDLIEHQEGLLAVLVPPPAISGWVPDEAFIQMMRGLAGVFGRERLSLAMNCPYGQDDRAYLQRLADLCAYTGVHPVATNDVHYHLPHRRPLQDVLTCIHHGCTLDEAGFLLYPNAERYLKPPQEMARLFAEFPGALERSIEITRQTQGFSLDQLRYEYPDEIVPPGKSPLKHLADLTWAGAAQRYPDGVPAKVRGLIEHELELIEELRYAPYFLTVHDLVVFARGRGILCQGGGAAAKSAVCDCLGVPSVDPDRVEMLFERFVSRERDEPPDIDIDFEHERREEVIQYLYRKYGRQRAALTAEVISYRPRSAVRDVGKALGLSLDCVDRLAKNQDWWSSPGAEFQAARLRELGLNPADPILHKLLILTRQIQGFPRHLSQHVGGFVITRGPLCESVPITNAAMPDRTVIEWDKDDIDALGMLKVDVLGLGMLTCIRKGFELVKQHHGRELTLATVPPQDEATYDMICRADTIGVFQIESRAQMSMLPRLLPRNYYDLVIEVAIVRPGPIQGDMVHPYLRRRRGQEPVTYPDEKVQQVLGRTLGVPLFQEQAMQLAITAAGFTPGEADQLRRAIASWKNLKGTVPILGNRLVTGLIEDGYPSEFAQRCFRQIQGFSEYGFPESHAASFALLVYVSAWLKRHFPAAFACALLNSQPMGFYAPAQIVRDARTHGIPIRPVDVNHSAWDCTLEDASSPSPLSSRERLGENSYPPLPQREGRGEGGPSNTSAPRCLRLGLRLVRGLARDVAERVAAAVQHHGPFPDIESLWHAAPVPIAALRCLAQADAFTSMGLDRQHALWQVQALHPAKAPLFADMSGVHPLPPPSQDVLPGVSEYRQVAHDYHAVGLTLRRHPLAFLREHLTRLHVTPAGELHDVARWPTGSPVAVAGVVLVRQRPGTASGIVFMTLEDETAQANLIVRAHIFDRDRKAARHATILLARGRLERDGPVVHILVSRLEDVSDTLPALAAPARDFH